MKKECGSVKAPPRENVAVLVKRPHLRRGAPPRESATAGRLRHRDRQRLSGIGTRRLLVRRLVQTRRQAEAALDVDLEGQAALALHTAAGVGEEVVQSSYGQRNNEGQCFAETTASAVVHEGSIVGIISGAVQVGCLVVCLNYRLVRVHIEN